jgi:hypothetical protein
LASFKEGVNTKIQVETERKFSLPTKEKHTSVPSECNPDVILNYNPTRLSLGLPRFTHGIAQQAGFR